MEELQRSSGHSVSLATLSNGEIVFLETLESTSSFRIASAIGAREAVHCTSVGKAMAAFLPVDALDRLFSEHPMRPLTPATITSRSRFEQELELIRSRGYATDIGECHVGAHGVGAAIFDRHGLVGGISISAPSGQMPEDEFPAIGGALRDAARKLSLELGGDPLLRDETFTPGSGVRPRLPAD
jgi:DNA-binding IclR family transcriptional regulator